VKRQKREKAMQCENANAMRKCEKNSHRIASLKNGGKTGKLIDRSLFRNRIRIALPALVLIEGHHKITKKEFFVVLNKSEISF
jgi:hypothetical protein